MFERGNPEAGGEGPGELDDAWEDPRLSHHSRISSSLSSRDQPAVRGSIGLAHRLPAELIHLHARVPGGRAEICDPLDRLERRARPTTHAHLPTVSACGR